MSKKITSQLNIVAQCKKYGLSIWECPHFLFLLMGALIILISMTTYFIGVRYIIDPLVVTLVVLFLSAVLFIISFAITQSFMKLAETARMKTEFISVASHQLRSPISNLKWTIEILMSGKLGRITKKQLEYIEILKENSGRMEDLINDLLIILKIDSRNFRLSEKETSLAELIKKLISEFNLFSKASNIEVRFQSQENLSEISIDPYYVKLAIGNLLDNAVRYTRSKGVIEIKLERRRKKAYFEIKDNGVGIPKEDHKHIFQKFFRSANVMRYQTQGSGLGLYITKSIIKKSGGKIGFRSSEGGGSIFWFTLPIK